MLERLEVIAGSGALQQILAGEPTGAIFVPPGANIQTAITQISSWQNQAIQKFTQNMGEALLQGMVRGLSSDPRGLETLQQVKKQVPQPAQSGINRAIEAQIQMMQSHLQRVDDPAIFNRYQQQIEENPAVQQQIQRFGPPQFFNQIEQKSHEMEQIQARQMEQKWQKMQDVYQQMFMAPPGQHPQEVMKMIPPQMRPQMEEFRQMMPQMPQPPSLRRPEGMMPIGPERQIGPMEPMMPGQPIQPGMPPPEIQQPIMQPGLP